MKSLYIILLAFTQSVLASAQHNPDSIAYLQQRKKINAMLAERAKKFGLYDQSLATHTGIFSFKAEKDVRRSNDILMDMVKADNDIYKELRVLPEYRTSRQKQVSAQSSDVVNSNLGYMTTINTLRSQMEALRRRAAMEEAAHEHTRDTLVLIIIGISVAAIGWLLFRPRKRPAGKGKRAGSTTRKRK